MVKARLGKLLKDVKELGQSFRLQARGTSFLQKPGSAESLPVFSVLSVPICQKLAFFISVVCSGLREACLFLQCCLLRFARSLPSFSVLSVPVCEKLAYFFSVFCSGLPEACLFFQCCLFRFARSLPIFPVLSVPVCQKLAVRHVTGWDKDYLRKIPRVVW
jgi:hypothetical protein